MRIVIAGNIGNQIGLQRDYELLRAYLESLGHEVFGQQDNRPADTEIPVCDLGIFLETISEHLVPMAKRFYYIANCEWLKPEFIRPIQRHCEKVFAKTREAERILREKFSRVHYIGFLTADKGDISIRREAEFLHVGGNGGHRGTNAVIAAWREYRYWNGLDSINDAHLTIISNSKTVEAIDNVPGITFIKRASEEELRTLQNRCLFHIQPSGTEGFGHALHESQSVGAILLTTQAPPMTELHAPFEIPSIRTKKANLGMVHEVSSAAIREMVPKMLALPNYEVAKMKMAARARFEKGNKEFAELFGPHLEPEKKVTFPSGSVVSLGKFDGEPFVGSGHSHKIAILGNFVPPHSTENDWAWSFEFLGHEVIKFQENEDRTDEILATCKALEVSLFLFVHTHSWSTPGKISLDEMIKGLRASKIPTVSPHLDLYFGLNDGDGRDSKVGKHPFWHTDLCLTADGSSQEKFAARGVNHSWLRPGVVARECYPGTFRKELETELAFVGAENYHNEWQWRGQMIRDLRSVYGDRFKVLNGFRGQRLNDLYASTKILIGDCCFAGKPRYYSDRWPESCGRGGFLLAPQIEGCCIPTATFTPQDIHDLMSKIDYYLAHEEERELIRRAAHLHVKEHDTYTHRAKDILGIFNL